MGLLAGRRAEARGIRGCFLSATPLLVLGLAVFVVALNISHYSTMCDPESPRDEALKKAAMERRIKTLEKEITQNSILFKKVLDALESTFEVSSLFSVEELRQLATLEAADVVQKRARQPAPPMSDYARAKVSAAAEGGNLQDLLEGAMSAVQSPALPAGDGNSNQGWDWGTQSQTVYDDDFLGIKQVESVTPPKFDVSEEERATQCQWWLTEHRVLPGVDWGTLRDEDQRRWREYHCDEVLDRNAAAAVMSIFGDPQPQPRHESEEGEEDGIVGAAEGGGGGDEEEKMVEENRLQVMTRQPNDVIAQSDIKDPPVPRGNGEEEMEEENRLQAITRQPNDVTVQSDIEDPSVPRDDEEGEMEEENRLRSMKRQPNDHIVQSDIEDPSEPRDDSSRGRVR